MSGEWWRLNNQPRAARRTTVPNDKRRLAMAFRPRLIAVTYGRLDVSFYAQPVAPA
jgi:hypothetical protein